MATLSRPGLARTWVETLIHLSAVLGSISLIRQLSVDGTLLVDLCSKMIFSETLHHLDGAPRNPCLILLSIQTLNSLTSSKFRSAIPVVVFDSCNKATKLLVFVNDFVCPQTENGYPEATSEADRVVSSMAIGLEEWALSAAPQAQIEMFNIPSALNQLSASDPSRNMAALSEETLNWHVLSAAIFSTPMANVVPGLLAKEIPKFEGGLKSALEKIEPKEEDKTEVEKVHDGVDDDRNGGTEGKAETGGSEEVMNKDSSSANVEERKEDGDGDEDVEQKKKVVVEETNEIMEEENKHVEETTHDKGDETESSDKPAEDIDQQEAVVISQDEEKKQEHELHTEEVQEHPEPVEGIEKEDNQSRKEERDNEQDSDGIVPVEESRESSAAQTSSAMTVQQSDEASRSTISEQDQKEAHCTGTSDLNNGIGTETAGSDPYYTTAEDKQSDAGEATSEQTGAEPMDEKITQQDDVNGSVGHSDEEHVTEEGQESLVKNEEKDEETQIERKDEETAENEAISQEHETSEPTRLSPVPDQPAQIHSDSASTLSSAHSVASLQEEPESEPEPEEKSDPVIYSDELKALITHAGRVLSLLRKETPLESEEMPDHHPETVNSDDSSWWSDIQGWTPGYLDVPENHQVWVDILTACGELGHVDKDAVSAAAPILLLVQLANRACDEVEEASRESDSFPSSQRIIDPFCLPGFRAVVVKQLEATKRYAFC